MKTGKIDSTLELDLGLAPTSRPRAKAPEKATSERPPVKRVTDFAAALRQFNEFGTATRETRTVGLTDAGEKIEVPTFINEFWTARQRQASSLHEVSYRACFKPQLPRFFIERLTAPRARVYDPFMGRGTTPVEAALLGRVPCGCDINPLSLTFTRPRLRPPQLGEVAQRLQEIDLHKKAEQREDLLAFYHPQTLGEISALREYLRDRRASGTLDAIDDWISVVSLNRLTGHSNGFFSVYSLPPNQAVSIQSQRKINERRKQMPPPRDVRKLILKKTRQLLGDCTNEVRQTLASVADEAILLQGAAAKTPRIPSETIDLVVTSPPFLNIVQYATDNWLRCWFMGIDAKSVALTVPSKIDAWRAAMTDVFRELARVLKPGGHVAFEVGEVHRGATKLEEHVLPCGAVAGLTPLLVMINDQEFTKTANCWGVDNNDHGTNTNRIVVFRKP